MAGGIFTSRPFEPNIKCVIFGFVAMGLYWFLPYRNTFLLPVIFIVVYIVIAIYDYVFNCNDKFYTGTSTPIGMIDSLFKPQRRNENVSYPRDKYLLENQEKMYRRNVYLFHLLIIAPLLIYVGFYGIKANEKIFPVLLSIGSIAGLYHGIRLFFPRNITC